MALATFYHPALTLTDTTVELSATESAHAIKSRRLVEGSAIQLINGLGLLAQARIFESSKRTTRAQVESVKDVVLTYSLTIATAIPKGDRQRTMIDMLTQVGVTDIIPLRCDRSVTRFKSTTQDKWKRYAIEACKQSQNPWLPKVSTERGIEDVLSSENLIAVYADAEGQSILSLKDRFQNKLTVLIGPEGGFSESEIEMLAKACQPISLGSNILRTELASVIAATQSSLIMKEN